MNELAVHPDVYATARNRGLISLLERVWLWEQEPGEGTRYDIDTPSHLAALAAQTGWKVDELMPLQAYRRYGYHVGNAVRAETPVVLSNP